MACPPLMEPVRFTSNTPYMAFKSFSVKNCGTYKCGESHQQALVATSPGCC